VEVNQRFAEYAASVAARGAVVWVHDYHLQLVPVMLRDRRPDLRIGFFLHTPCPSATLMAHLPWRHHVIEGLLGADVLGFQTPRCVDNFRRVARRYVELRGRGRQVEFEGRTVVVGAFPISVDFERFDQMARDPVVARRAEQFKATLGAGRKVLLGVDRLDYTKGIDLRLKAYQEVLSSSVGGVRKSVLVQVAVPSRERIHEYRTLRRQIDELVGQINGNYGEVGVAAVHYLRRNYPLKDLLALYRAADVMVVTPLADGMNLVAKEFVAARVDDAGMLVLSEFAGASEELKTALRINPHDVDGMAEAMQRALEMPAAEVKKRMRAMRRVVRRHTVHDWAREFLQALGADGTKVGT
jgi:trehalose-6-phosphate synthase